MILGALIFLAGLVSGVGLRSLPPRRSRVAACQCDHPRALHDPVTNRCYSQIKREGWLFGPSYVTCNCRSYVGPEPLPSVFSTGVELPSVDES